MSNTPPKPPLPPIDNDLFRSVKEYLTKLYYYVIGMQIKPGKGIKVTRSATGQTVSTLPEEIVSEMSYYGSFRDNKYTAEVFGEDEEPLKLVIKEGYVLRTDEDAVIVLEKEIDIKASTYSEVDPSESSEPQEESFVWVEVTLDQTTMVAELKDGEYPGFDNDDGKQNFIIGRIIKFPEAEPIPYRWDQHFLGDITIQSEAVKIANCDLIIPESESEDPPPTPEEQDLISPGVYHGLNLVTHTEEFHRLNSVDAASGEAKVGVEKDDDGCLINILPVTLPGAGIPGGHVSLSVKGGEVWISTRDFLVNGIATTQVFHINLAGVHATHTIAVGDVIGFDATGHIVEINSTRVIPDYPIPPPVPDDPYPIPVPDTPITVVKDVIITGFLYDDGTTDTVVDICEFDLIDVLFHLEKPVSTPFTGYDTKTGVIQGFVKGTSDFVKWKIGVGIEVDVRDSIALLNDATNHGIETLITQNAIMLPPSAYESGSTEITITYNVPIVGLSTSLDFGVCPFTSTLIIDPAETNDIPFGEDANWFFFMSLLGAKHGIIADYDGRYELHISYKKQSTNETIKAEIIDEWEDVTPVATEFVGVTLLLTAAEMAPFIAEGDTVCVKVKVYDLAFNAFVTDWEEENCRLIPVPFCWSDPFNQVTLNATRWDESADTNADQSFDASGMHVVKTANNGNTLYSINNQFETAAKGGTDNPIPASQTFKMVSTFSGTFSNTTSTEAITNWGVNLGSGALTYKIQISKNSFGLDSQARFAIIKGSTVLYDETTGSTSGTTEIRRVANNDLQFYLNGALKFTQTNAGDATTANQVDTQFIDAISNGNSDGTWTFNCSDFQIESPLGTPYCSVL